MTDVFLLGAGFSKAINKQMPTMAELAQEVREGLRGSGHGLPKELERYQDDIEMWMSYLSQVQPWLSGPEMDSHRSLAGRIRQLIGQILEERAWRITGSAPPEWFSRLVLCWHKRQAVIITLNYDTLIESAARAGVPEEPRAGENLQDNKRRILPVQIYPPYFTNVAARRGAGLWGEGLLRTFRLLKLHGSVNWYYSGREIFFGETIFYNDIPEFEIPADENARSRKLEQLTGLVGDKEMLIIPPVSEKTTYFNNETIRALWREAGKALRDASTVYIIGYSLPPSDLGMQMFLRGNQPSPKTRVFVVDINAKVVDHIGNILRDCEMRNEFAGPGDRVARFVNHYRKESP